MINKNLYDGCVEHLQEMGKVYVGDLEMDLVLKLKEELEKNENWKLKFSTDGEYFIKETK